MTATTKLGLQLLANAAGNQLNANSSFATLNQLVQAVAVSRLSAPPGSPADEDMYIVTDTATGEWAGREDDLAFWLTSAGAWQFITPSNGWSVWVANEGVRYELLAGVWQPASSGGGDATTQPQSLCFVITAEATAPTTGAAKYKQRMPYGFTLSEVRASLSTAQTSGSILTVDVNATGVSMLSTKLTIDNSESTSLTAAVPAVISSSDISNDIEISVDVDKVGTGGKGLKVYLIGTPAPAPAAGSIPTTIGESFGGGYYIGDITDGAGVYALIMAGIAGQGDSKEWNTTASDTAGTASSTAGPANTAAMVAATDHPAAIHCDSYSGGGFVDWYLPAKDELALAWTNIGVLSGLAMDAEYYWSSTQNDSTTAWRQEFYAGGQSSGSNYLNYRVRPVRRILK